MSGQQKKNQQSESLTLGDQQIETLCESLVGTSDSLEEGLLFYLQKVVIDAEKELSAETFAKIDATIFKCLAGDCDLWFDRSEESDRLEDICNDCAGNVGL